MRDKRTYRLNSANSVNSVNLDTFDKLEILSKTNLLPIGDVDKVINAGEQFNLERKDSNFYRLSGTLNTMFTNVLFNVSGDNSFSSFNTPLLRDRTFPSNGIFPSNGEALEDDEDLTYDEAIKYHLKERNGWYGYENPDDGSEVKCLWVDMAPNRGKFMMDPTTNPKNWELIVTYPSNMESNFGDITYQGLTIVDSFTTKISNRDMVTFTTPVKHGLSQGETVKMSGILVNGVSIIKEYTVIRIGKNNGDEKEYHFSLDINQPVTLDGNPKMVRLYNGNPSQYYFRLFSKINVRSNSDVMETDDYEIFPLAFSQNIYEDKINHFIINEDIDTTGLLDNLGRPLSELYITLIKTDSDGTFTPVKAGVDMPWLSGIESNLGIPDIRRINNGPNSHNNLSSDVNVNDQFFYGDVVEYNVLELTEKVLANVYHTFNSVNRETNDGFNNLITNVDFSGKTIELGVRYEGYVYNPHTKVKIKEYSSYIEQGDSLTYDKPSYAIDLKDGRYLWRDLMDVGVNDIKETVLDYPFLNGTHYINMNISFPLKRQDPFGLYGVKYDSYPPDISGILMEDNSKINNSQNVC